MDDVDKLQPFLFLQPDTIANIRTRWGYIIVRSNNVYPRIPVTIVMLHKQKYFI